MAVGSVLSYALLAFQGLSFLLPNKTGKRYKRIFAGTLNSFPIGEIKKFAGPLGEEVLVKRETDEISAFSSVCPHLGCKVHWVEEDLQFLCPCHNGVFDADGTPVSGPPADAGQPLQPVPLHVDEEAGLVYIEVKETDIG